MPPDADCLDSVVVPALCEHIVNVLLSRPCPQVFRVDAPSVVAGMADVMIGGNRSDADLVDLAM